MYGIYIICILKEMTHERETMYPDNFSDFTLLVGHVVAQWLVRLTWDLKVQSSSPGTCTHVAFLGRTLTSHSAIQVYKINVNQQIALETT